MKRRTIRNFMLVMDILQDVKHYTRSESERLARQVFDECEADKGKGNRSVEWFLAKIVTKEEWLEEKESRA